MPINNPTILVTGATGFLGTAVLNAFARHQHAKVIAACRDPLKLPKEFTAEIRQGDLCDPAYRHTVVKGVDVICHAGTWASMWGHKETEYKNFYLPTLDLIEQAIAAGVKRFVLSGSVVMASREKPDTAIDDFSPANKTGFWPHVDYLIDIDDYMKNNAHRGLQMVTLRLGHFIGKGNKLGLVPVLVPRLRTRLVPWLAAGTSRLPLIADTDLGNSFVDASLAQALDAYESFNICGNEFPTTREVVHYIAEKTGLPLPFMSLPYAAAYPFAWLMETLFPILPGKAPFLTRSVVHLAEQWVCATDYAKRKLNFQAQKDWRTAMDEALEELKASHYPWPSLMQALSDDIKQHSLSQSQ